MKDLIKITSIIILSALLLKFAGCAIKEGWRRELNRQCVVAQDTCDKYPASCGDVERYCK